MRLYVHLAHVDAEVVGDDVGQIQQQSHAVDAQNLDLRQRREFLAL